MNFAALTLGTSEYRVVLLAASVVGCFGLWRFARWLVAGAQKPEPWDDEVAAAMTSEEAVPLCCRCLEPHHESADFCPVCGAPVGTYTNLLPFPYLFSLGDLLRVGTSG